ncbi:hypothetical protein C8F01DRAFT_305082 [Mycena amicta]|nr:hypothetical protein C8F01DRAFT_305082 [Mycena amicta]
MSSQTTPALMTSPVFRYAVLVVLTVVVILGAGVCYRTRVTQRRMFALHGGLPVPIAASPREWGPKPSLFDAYIQEPQPSPTEKARLASMMTEWDSMTPISVARGKLDASGASSMARISIMICMPFSEPFTNESLPEDERYPPHLEFGHTDVRVALNAKALRVSSDSTSVSNKKGS